MSVHAPWPYEARDAALFGGALMLLVVSGGPSELFHAPLGLDTLAYLGREVATKEILAFGAMLAVVLADRWVGRGASPAMSYALVITAGCMLAIALQATIPLHLDADAKPWSLRGVRMHALHDLFVWLPLLAGAGVPVRADASRAPHARAPAGGRARAFPPCPSGARFAPPGHAGARRAEAAVRHPRGRAPLYAADRAAAEQTLDDLIAYLRAAMPRMREASSTVAREMELARAYAAIVAMAQGPPGLDARIGPDVADARFPPMIVLPLVGAALCNGAARIEAARRGDRVHLSIAGDVLAGSIEGRDDLGAVRERLHALYGARASVALERSSAGFQLAIDVPCEHASTEGAR